MQTSFARTHAPLLIFAAVAVCILAARTRTCWRGGSRISTRSATGSWRRRGSNGGFGARKPRDVKSRCVGCEGADDSPTIRMTLRECLPGHLLNERSCFAVLAALARSTPQTIATPGHLAWVSVRCDRPTPFPRPPCKRATSAGDWNWGCLWLRNSQGTRTSCRLTPGPAAPRAARLYPANFENRQIGRA